MINRWSLFLLLAICLAVVPTQNAHAGEADEVLLGFVYGTSFGILLGGALLAFYTNPDSDKNFDTVLITCGISGAVGGVIFGSLLPDDAVERDPVISLIYDGDWDLALTMPQVSVTTVTNGFQNSQKYIADLFRFDF